MFENLQKCIDKPVRNMVNRHYTASVVSRILSAEIEALTPEENYTSEQQSNLNAYMFAWIALSLFSDADCDLRFIYNVSRMSEQRCAKMLTELFDAPALNLFSSDLMNIESRKLFVHICHLSKLDQRFCAENLLDCIFDYDDGCTPIKETKNKTNYKE